MSGTVFAYLKRFLSLLLMRCLDEFGRTLACLIQMPAPPLNEHLHLLIWVNMALPRTSGVYLFGALKQMLSAVLRTLRQLQWLTYGTTDMLCPNGATCTSEKSHSTQTVTS